MAGAIRDVDMTEPIGTSGLEPGGHDTGGAAREAARGYLTIEELAEHTGFSVSTLRRLWRKRQIVGFQPGGRRTRVVFPPDAIEQASRATQGAAAGPPESRTATPRRGPRPKWLGGQPQNEPRTTK
jgi:excisionase family DNA binding protein